MIGRRPCLCTVSFLKTSFLESWTSGAVLVVLVLLLQGMNHYSGTFLFLFYNSFFWLCASVLLLGHCVVAEAECNWYLLNINIYSLSKKKVAKLATKHFLLFL
jgi:hypothetical protein